MPPSRAPTPTYQPPSRDAEAEPLYRGALHIYENALGPSAPEVVSPLSNLGGLYREQGRYREAEPFYRRALAVVEQTFGPDHGRIAVPLGGLAALYNAQGRY